MRMDIIEMFRRREEPIKRRNEWESPKKLFQINMWMSSIKQVQFASQ